MASKRVNEAPWEEGAFEPEQRFPCLFKYMVRLSWSGMLLERNKDASLIAPPSLEVFFRTNALVVCVCLRC